MKIALISDTHGKHGYIDVPVADMIIHAGDISPNGRKDQIADFFYWFERLPHKHKICIAGNHDWLAERDTELFRSMVPANVIYLEDSGVTIEGLNIWGTPVQPEFRNWAFNRQRGTELKEHWDMIPKNTNILITHGAPWGIGDRCDNGFCAGCSDLTDKTEDLEQLKLHVFGHIHEGYGHEEKWGIKFVNASVLDVRYRPVNPPIVVEL